MCRAATRGVEVRGGERAREIRLGGVGARVGGGEARLGRETRLGGGWRRWGRRRGWGEREGCRGWFPFRGRRGRRRWRRGWRRRGRRCRGRTRRGRKRRGVGALGRALERIGRGRRAERAEGVVSAVGRGRDVRSLEGLRRWWRGRGEQRGRGRDGRRRRRPRERIRLGIRWPERVTAHLAPRRHRGRGARPSGARVLRFQRRHLQTRQRRRPTARRRSSGGSKR